MLSFPFNSSTPILYYNKDQFRARRPRSRRAAQRPGRESRPPRASCANTGIACGITTDWPAWINIENFSAFHNVPIATQDERHRRHRRRIADQQPRGDRPYRDAGRLAEEHRFSIIPAAPTMPSAASTTSECGILISSSAARADIIANAKFEIGYGMLPYWPNVQGAPQNSIIGGGSLWVLQGPAGSGIQGRRPFLRVLVAAGRAGVMASMDRLSADRRRRPTNRRARSASTTATRAPISRSSR